MTGWWLGPPISVFTGLGREGPSLPQMCLCILQRPQSLGGQAEAEGREGGTVLVGLFFFIFEWFPAPSPKPFSLTVSRKFLSHKEG